MRKSARRKLTARVQRLLLADQECKRTEEVELGKRIRHEANALMTELLPRTLKQDLDAATWLIRVSDVAVRYNAAFGNRFMAIGAGSWAQLGAATLTRAIAEGRLPHAEAAYAGVLGMVRGMPEMTARHAHQAGAPLAALPAIETLTGILSERLMGDISRSAVVRKALAGAPVEAQLHGSMPRGTAPWLADGAPARDSADFNREMEARLLAALATPDLPDPLDQFFMTGPMEQPVRAARLTGRVVVYVTAARSPFHDGVAIRVNPDNSTSPLVESVWLPGLDNSTVNAHIQQVRAAFDAAVEQQRLKPITGGVQELLDWTGQAVWGPLLEKWPDLAERPVALIPVSAVGLLPLFTATVHGRPACSLLDVTLAPTAALLHFAALPADAAVHGALVAVDDENGRRPHFVEEADRIAALLETESVLYRTASPDSPGPVHDIARRLRGVSVAHFSCHGEIDDTHPTLRLGGKIRLTEMLTADRSSLDGRPLVVLSACDLGGFAEHAAPAEQFGFPVALLGLGARAVVGSFWPILDSSAGVEIMTSFYRNLAYVSSRAALALTLTEAFERGLSPAFWGSLTHFGA